MADVGDELLRTEYHRYLERFASVHGDLEMGEFAKHEGQLIKKLTLDEFVVLFDEFTEMEKTYLASVRRGDTINDIVVKVLRQRSADLVLPVPV